MKKLYIYILIFSIISYGCTSKKDINKNSNKLILDKDESVDVNYIFNNIEKEEMTLYIEKKDYKLNLYEPEKGIYLGSYINLDNDDSIKAFENLVEKEHAFYTYNTKLNSEVPLNFILTCISKAKTPNIILTSLNDLNYFDTTYLEKIAKEYGQLYVPIFLNFCPYESSKNYNKEEYINFYKKSREVFKLYASNVAFVWSVNQNDILDCYDYYPGDEYVDWIGIDIYDTLDDKTDIFNILDYFYYTYQGKKPIMLSKLGISHFSNDSYIYKTSQAAEELIKIYNKIIDEYHNIKAINYININEINSYSNNTKYNFSITDDEEILKAYKESIKKDDYLSSIDFSTSGENVMQLLKSPFKAYKIENNIYISQRSFTHNLKNIDLENMGKYLFTINNEKYYKLDILDEIMGYEYKILDKKIFIKSKN